MTASVTDRVATGRIRLSVGVELGAGVSLSPIADTLYALENVLNFQLLAQEVATLVDELAESGIAHNPRSDVPFRVEGDWLAPILWRYGFRSERHVTAVAEGLADRLFDSDSDVRAALAGILFGSTHAGARPLIHEQERDTSSSSSYSVVKLHYANPLDLTVLGVATASVTAGLKGAVWLLRSWQDVQKGQLELMKGEREIANLDLGLQKSRLELSEIEDRQRDAVYRRLADEDILEGRIRLAITLTRATVDVAVVANCEDGLELVEKAAAVLEELPRIMHVEILEEVEGA